MAANGQVIFAYTGRDSSSFNGCRNWSHDSSALGSLQTLISNTNGTSSMLYGNRTVTLMHILEKMELALLGM